MRKYFAVKDRCCLLLAYKDIPYLSLAFLLILSVLTLFLLSGCGGRGGGGSGGGGGGSSSGGSGGGGVLWLNTVTSTEADNYRTAEYNAQWGLEAIHAAEGYALLAKNNKTVAGDLVKIAVIDTGAQTTHVEIAANFDAADSHNYSSDAGNGVNDSGSHGTHVSSTAAGVKDGVGIHGVAYDANIVVSKTLPGSTNDLKNAIVSSASIDGVKVINASVGYDDYTAYNGSSLDANAEDINIINSLGFAKTHDVLVVVATGNDADNAHNDDGSTNYYIEDGVTYTITQNNNYDAFPKPSKPALFANNPDLEGYVIAVGAVDANSNIADFSNNCTVAKAYCLVAPGVAIHAALPTNTYGNKSGTSMAAPHVAGAVAVIRGAWTHLTAPQTAQILFSSATHLGTSPVGVPDDIYGWGLLNLYAAVQAQGSNTLGYGNSVVLNAGYDVRSSAIYTDPIFGDAFTQNVAPALANAVFFDDYGRDYKALLDRKITTRNNSSIVSNLNGILLNNYKTNNIPISFSANKAEGISTQIRMQVRSYSNDLAARFSNLDRSLEDKTLNANNGLSFAQNVNSNNRVAFSFNVDEITNSYSDKFQNIGFISINSIAANPYQSFVGGASQNLQIAQDSQKNFNQLFFEHKLFDEKLKMNFSYQTSYQGSAIKVGKGAQQNQIMDVNVAYNPDKKTNLMFSFGNLNEFNNNFLNSQAVGAFETGSDVKTSYTKIVLNRELLTNLSLMASYSEGITKAAGNNEGIFRDYQNIRSRSMSFGLMAEKVLGGRFGVLYSEPLRVYSGKAKIDIPVARDDAGNITRYRADISLRPEGKQQNFEMVYGRDVGINAQLNFNFMVSKDVANIKGNNARLGMLIYRLRF